MTPRNILIVALIIAVIAFFIYRNKKQDTEMVSYKLPTSPDPAIFGPKYWFALHDITGRIPCGTCRGFAEKFMIFFHDVINNKLSRPLYDPDNYSEMLLYLNSPKTTT